MHFGYVFTVVAVPSAMSEAFSRLIALRLTCTLPPATPQTFPFHLQLVPTALWASLQLLLADTSLLACLISSLPCDLRSPTGL